MHDDIERGQRLVGEVERAVSTDVALDAGEEREAVHLAVDLPNPLGVRQRPLIIEAVGHGQRLRMVGDRDVFASLLAGAPRHRQDVMAAVGFRRMHVDVAAQIGERDQPRQRACLGGVDLSPQLAERRVDEGEAQRCVQAFLGLASHLVAGDDVEEAIFVQGEPAVQRALAQGDVVRFRAREILQRRPACVRRDQPQIGLESLPQQDARLRLALAEHALDQLVAGEARHDPGGGAGREDVDVAARLGAAPQAADDVEGRRRRRLPEPVHERFGDARRVAHQVPPHVLLALRDGGDV